MEAESGQQIDRVRLERMRWRTRRGLLENDIVLRRFLAAREEQLSVADMEGLDILLDLPDGELLDLILARSEPQGRTAGADARRVLEWLRCA